MNIELDNPFIEMLKTQINELKTGKISQALYIVKAKDTIKYLERWVEDVSKLAFAELLYKTTPIKIEPKNSNFNMRQEKP